MRATLRGFALEEVHGANLAKNYKTFDIWDPVDKVATSLKSIDPNVSSYHNNIGAMTSKLKGYVNEAANFKSWAGRIRNGPRLRLTDEMIDKKVLNISLPGNLTEAQKKAIDSVKEFGETKGVTVTTTVVSE